MSGFAQSAPNALLMRFAEGETVRSGHHRALDLGCGAGRNAVPLAASGWNILGLDLSWPMLVAASARGIEAGVADRLAWAMAPMESIPTKGQSFDLIIAHGIWNLAPSVALFRRAVEEAARVAHHETALFVFTFSRNTLPPDVPSVPGEPFILHSSRGNHSAFSPRTSFSRRWPGSGSNPTRASN